jgi:hypothetical protein
MTVAVAILAESGIGEVLGILALFLIMGLASLGKWFAEQKKERERREEIEELKRKRLGQQGTMPLVDRDDGGEQETFGHETSAPPAAAATSTRQRAVRRTYRLTPPATMSQQPTRVVRPPQDDAEDRVADDLRQERERRRRKDLERQQRLAAYRPDEADTVAIEKRLISVRSPLIDDTAGQMQQAAGGLQMNLKNPSAARNAVVMHEILGPPKALQNEQTLWET